MLEGSGQSGLSYCWTLNDNDELDFRISIQEKALETISDVFDAAVSDVLALEVLTIRQFPNLQLFSPLFFVHFFPCFVVLWKQPKPEHISASFLRDPDGRAWCLHRKRSITNRDTSVRQRVAEQICARVLKHHEQHSNLEGPKIFVTRFIYFTAVKAVLHSRATSILALSSYVYKYNIALRIYTYIIYIYETMINSLYLSDAPDTTLFPTGSRFFIHLKNDCNEWNIYHSQQGSLNEEGRTGKVGPNLEWRSHNGTGNEPGDNMLTSAEKGNLIL